MGLTVTSFLVTVSTSGTAVPLTAIETNVHRAIVQATAANTNNMYLSGSDVSTTNGLALDAGQSITLAGREMNGSEDTIDLAKIYLDADTNGETAMVTAFTWS